MERRCISNLEVFSRVGFVQDTFVSRQKGKCRNVHCATMCEVNVVQCLVGESHSLLFMKGLLCAELSNSTTKRHSRRLTFTFSPCRVFPRQGARRKAVHLHPRSKRRSSKSPGPLTYSYKTVITYSKSPQQQIRNRRKELFAFVERLRP